MSDELIDPYQNENSNFDGGGQRPPQTEEQISKAFDVTEYMRDVIDPSSASTWSISASSTTSGSKRSTARRLS